MPSQTSTSTCPSLASTACRILLFGWLARTAEAAPYLYIDATPSNTTLNGAALVDRNANPTNGNYFVQVGTGMIGSGTDAYWSFRNSAGYENGNYFESDNVSSAGDAENTAPLVTTITPATIGTHEIVVIFARNSGRDIAAKIGSAPRAGDVFTTSSPLTLNPNQTATTDPLFIPFDGSYSNGRGSNAGAAYLGQVTTTVPNQAVKTYIDGLIGTSGTQDERTQYDGIGYRPYTEPPPPEPKHRDVFLIAGQSNADGRGLKAELTGGLSGYAGQQSGVLIHYTNPAYTNADKSRYKKWVTLEPGYSVPPGYSGALPTSTFGEEIGAAKVLTTQYANPAIIKVTRGGTALGVPGTDWYPARLDSPDVGPLHEALIESTQQALAELTAAGDTYTVHAMFWHQGESDGGRTAEYGGLLTTLIESVRRDLGMPNLRVLVGELAPTKPQDFRDVQWQVARGVPNANFISSRGLVTFEGTHFTTQSMVTLGERIGYALLPSRDTLDFELPTCATGALDRQDECSATDGLASVLQVAATITQGEYTGGQAAGHVGTGGAYFFTRRNLLPLAGARSLQADFFPGDTGYDNEADADSTLLVAGWGTDAGNDGLFTDAEAAIGLGVHQTGTFRIQIGGTTHLATGFSYQTDRWYRLTLIWSEPDAGGDRTVQLFARDLSTGTDLNGGLPVLTLENITHAGFDGNPAHWSGLGCHTIRGLVDNIRIVPQGFAAWTTALYPGLAGDLLDDDDHDGICNALEFAFGLNPLSPDPSSALPQPVFGPAAASVSVNPLATQPGILYQVEWSRNLSSWTTVTGTRSGSLLEFTFPTAGEPSIFLRHGVEVNE